ncbi:MAG: IPT/TIG domain-containing protein, partial [Acidimicrobiales bacterium]
MTFDANGNATVQLQAAGNNAGTVTLKIDDVTTTSATAAAVAVRLTFAVQLLNGAGTVTGTVTIAEASCESPDAIAPLPTATGINPNQGPTTGGTPVTITGTGFIPGQTTVTIGGNTVPA